jgi:hypothetical protein
VALDDDRARANLEAGQIVADVVKVIRSNLRYAIVESRNTKLKRPSAIAHPSMDSAPAVAHPTSGPSRSFRVERFVPPAFAADKFVLSERELSLEHGEVSKRVR